MTTSLKIVELKQQLKPPSVSRAILLETSYVLTPSSSPQDARPRPHPHPPTLCFGFVLFSYIWRAVPRTVAYGYTPWGCGGSHKFVHPDFLARLQILDTAKTRRRCHMLLTIAGRRE